MNRSYKKLGINTLLFTIGSLGQKLLTFLFVPFYTAILSTSDYGTTDLIVTIVSLIWPIFTLQIDEAILRFCLDKENSKKTIISIGFWTNIIGIVPMLLFSVLILGVPVLKPYYLLFVLYYCSYTMNCFTSYAAKGLEKVSLFALSGIVTSIVVISCNIFFLIVLKIGIIGYLLSYILGYSITSVFVLKKGKLYKYIRLLSQEDKKIMKELCAYSLPLIPNSICWWVNNSLDRLMVAAMCGVSGNGLLAVAYKIPSMLTTMSSMFSNAWQISAVEDFGSDKSKKMYSAIYNKYVALNIFIVSAITLFVKLIAKILFSKDFYGAWVYAPALVFASMFMILSGFLGTIYTSSKKTKMVFYSTVIGAVVNIILNYILIKTIGIQGAAVATLVSQVIIWAIRAYDSQKILRLDVKWHIHVLCFILIGIEIYIMCANFMCSIWVSAVIVLVLALINRSIIEEIILIMKRIIIKKLGRKA